MHIKRRAITIFAAMIISNHIFCMEKENQISHPYKNIEDCLKDTVAITDDGIEYNILGRDFQYDLLKGHIKNNLMNHLRLCLEYKFSPNRYRKGPSLFHCAIEHHKPKAISILAEYNPDLIPRNQEGQTPLDYAVHLKCKSCITAMGNAIGNKCNELLQYKKHCGLTKHILKPGFCRECVGDLLWELKHHNLKEDYPYNTLKRFLQENVFSLNKAKSNSIPTDIQCKMLKTYIKNGALDFLKLCLAYKFNPDHAHKKLSLLHYTIKCHKPEAITILAAHNPNLIMQNTEQQTPLDYAASLKCEDCANAMVVAIVTKINQLRKYKRCESTNRYVDALIRQLKKHELYEEEDTAPVTPLFITDNAAIVTEKSSPS